MKKILFILLFIFSFLCMDLTFSADAEGEKYVRVIYNSIDVFDSANAGGDSNVIGACLYGERLKLLSENEVLGDDGYKYYLVEFNGENGYVFVSQVVPDAQNSPKRELDTNAMLDQDSYVFTKDNEEDKTEIILPAGTKVRVLDGLDYSKAFTRIQYQDENMNIFVGYIKTITIKKSGISRTTIGAICIIVATVSIVLVSFGIKGRLKKKLKGKN